MRGVTGAVAILPQSASLTAPSRREPRPLRGVVAPDGLEWRADVGIGPYGCEDYGGQDEQGRAEALQMEQAI